MNKQEQAGGKKHGWGFADQLLVNNMVLEEEPAYDVVWLPKNIRFCIPQLDYKSSSVS